MTTAEAHLSAHDPITARLVEVHGPLPDPQSKSESWHLWQSLDSAD